ncbi:MAG: hypothetical protein UV79_C0002G0006 [candidate division TM6 bacterium GW2011_GWF2_43_17]|nr:MAG: hypothetical protein UV79_C0002G0006 [candidate division TM6 bacterium GW2011_GWF2_43_17]HAU30177.1 hypothetical protein [Candidatus Dependentiae bacterium]
MIVNALLLFQIIHFLLAYLILKYVLLRPALILMKRLDREKLLLESNVALLGEEAARREAVIDAQWKRHCRVLYLRYEKGTASSKGQDIECLPQMTASEVSPEQIKQLRHHVTTDIVQQLVKGD